MVRPGTGKYDEICRMALEKTKGQAVTVVVVEGVQGTGMSVMEEFSVAGSESHIARLPKVLREIADEIEKSFK